MSTTSDPNDPRLTRGIDAIPVPQAPVYLVLSEEERAKGWVRPYRDTYCHVGIRPQYPTRPLTPEEHERHDKHAPGGQGYDSYEEYPEGSPQAERGLAGRYWTAAQLRSGCGARTVMGRPIAETYARQPDFYGSTYCVTCQKHLALAEFRWVENDRVTDLVVGS